MNDTFTSKVSTIKDNLHTLEQYTSKLHQKTRTKATNVLDHTQEDTISRDISAIEQMFKETVKKVKNDIEIMHNNLQHLKYNSNNVKSLSYVTQNTHCNALTKRLTRVLNAYRNVQVEYRNREEHRAISQFIIENPGIDAENAKDTMDNIDVNPNLNENKVISSAERNKRVKKLAESIGELCMLIDELHEMIKSQDCVVDKIEIHTDNTLSSTGRAVAYLKNALRFQIEATKMKRILMLVAFLIISFLIIYLALKIGSIIAAFS